MFCCVHIEPQPIMLKILSIMLLNSVQKTNPLCSILCQSPLQLCHSWYTVLLFLMTAQHSYAPVCCVLYHAMLQWSHIMLNNYYVHEKNFTLFYTKLAWLLYYKINKDCCIKSDDQNAYKSTNNNCYQIIITLIILL